MSRVRVPSSDHVSVAIHRFGGIGRPFLLSHATGFHAYCYLPIADRLTDRFEVFGLDYRGHGSTARPDDWAVDWDRYGDDALAAATAIAPGGGLMAFGHSMGAAALMMAAHRRPGLFDLIVAFEPIVFPMQMERPENPTPMIDAARRRQASFASFDDAIANYRSKPPMSAFDPDVLRLYVAHGFRPAPEGIRLNCDPEHEARTFETGAEHATWDLLPEIDTRVVVVAGEVSDAGPSMVAEPIAERLANGRYVELPTSNHLGPFIDPDESAELIFDALSTL